MSGDAATPPISTPVHLWVVGGISLLWNAFGAFDYLMTQTENEGYMSQFTPEQLEYFYGYPTWTVAFWALAVWGSVLGSALLLARKKLAAPVFLVSLACLVVNSVYSFGLSDGLQLMGTTGAVFSGVIFVAAVALWLYARAMVQRGVLT